MQSLGACLEQLDHWRIEADRHGTIDFEHEPRASRRSAPALARPVAVPRAVHPQVGAQLEPAVEADQQVLALALDRVDALADHSLDLGDRPGSLCTCGPDVATD